MDYKLGGSFVHKLMESYSCLKLIESKEDNFSPTMLYLQLTEAVVLRCSVEKVFLEISQNSQENTCASVSFFNKVAGGLQLY